MKKLMLIALILCGAVPLLFAGSANAVYYVNSGLTHLGNMGGSYIGFSVADSYVQVGSQTSNGWAITDPSSGLAVSLKASDVNLTVTRVFNGKITEFTGSGSSPGVVYLLNAGEASPVSVSAVSSWGYDPVTHVSTLQLVNPNSSVVVDWNVASDGAPSGSSDPSSGGVIVYPSPSPSDVVPGETPQPNVSPLPLPLPGGDFSGFIIVAAIVVIAVCVVLYAQDSKPSRRRARKQLLRRGGLKRPKLKRRDSLL
jgi:hypothetical protein